MIRPTSRFSPASLLLSACCAALLAGCTVTIPDPNDNGNGNGGGGNPPNTIRIRVVNNTNSTIDPDIYITGDAVTDAAQLFAPSRKFTRYGVGNRGLLGGRDSDEFTVDCSVARVLGTQGGLFSGADDDVDNPAGVGQQRILSQNLGFLCGDVIEFAYSRSGDTFTTTVSLSQ